MREYGDRRWKFVGFIFALMATLIPLTLFVSGVSVIVVASESVAYRYFTKVRLLAGEPGLLFLPQGQSVDALQQLIVWVQQAVLRIPPDSLRVRFDSFGYLTLLVNGVFTGAALLIAFTSTHLRPLDKVSVGVVSLIATYGSASGISMAMMPDYYGFETSITITALVVALVSFRRDDAIGSWSAVAAAGILTGLALATKLTLVVIACLPMCVLLLKSRPTPAGTAARVLLFGVAACVSAGFAIGAAYGFDWWRAVAAAGAWLAFVRNPGAEPNFWSSLLWPFVEGGQPGADYLYALILVPALTAVVVSASIQIAREKDQRGRLLLVAIAGAMLAHLWALSRRPAGTTLWELVLFWSAATVLVCALIRHERSRAQMQATFIAIGLLVVIPSVVINAPRLLPIPVLQESTKKLWDAHAFLQRQGGEKMVVIPDNRYAIGSVEEILMKGVSDFPTWNITTGHRVLSDVAPGLTFRTNVDRLDSQTTVMWIDIPGETSLATRFPALGIREVGTTTCKRWDIRTWEWWQRRIVICPRVSPGSAS